MTAVSPRLRYKRWLEGGRHWGWRVLAVAGLHYLTLMALPLTLIELGSRFAALPIVAGFVLEILRARLRRGLRSEIRESFLRDAALQALDKRSLVPEADVDSAFWAAQLTEYAITVDIPAAIAASFAGACIFALASPAVSAGSTGGLLAILVSMFAVAVWSNRRRAPHFGEVVDNRQRTAGWIAAAERDCGEIYGDRARGPFLARLTRSIEAWSYAQNQLERQHLRHRLLIGGMFVVGVLAFLRARGFDLLHWDMSRGMTARNISGLLLLGTGVPVAYVLAVHTDSLLTTHAALKKLHPLPRRSPDISRVLAGRPSRLSGRSVSFSYSSGACRPALTAVDFELDLRRITVVVAPNGAGKTTLTRLICGVLSPNSGTLEIDGIPCADVSRDDIGLVPQNPLIVDTLSIEDNIRLAAPDTSTDAIGRLLVDLGLFQPMQQLAGQLSRGEQRRIAVARAILKDPRLLVLDEPDVWLDEEGRARLAQVLDRELANRAVIVVSHRTEWLPRNVNIIDLSGHPSPASAAPFGRSSACG